MAFAHNLKIILPFQITAGYPTAADTVELMLAMQAGGTSVIELGVPYTDPQADGATIQLANQMAIKGGTKSVGDCLKFVSEARAKGLTIPVILMGYYNPFYQYGIPALAKDSAANGVDGFIVVDLPPEESNAFVSLTAAEKVRTLDNSARRTSAGPTWGPA